MLDNILCLLYTEYQLPSYILKEEDNVNIRERDVILLLRDYMNFLPSGPQEAYVPLGSGYGSESDWPLTAESLRRLDKTTLTGDTYSKLDDALNKLDFEHPNLYEAILDIYLREEAGHRDVDHLREVVKRGSPYVAELLTRHDEAITKLAKWLAEDDLYIRYPHKATGPKPGQDMKEKHDHLFEVFKRFWEKGEGTLPYRQALYNAVHKMDGYYSNRHADRIIRARLRARDEQA